VVAAGSSSSSSSSSSHATLQLDPAVYGYQGCFCKAPLAAVMQQYDGRTVSMTCVAKQVRCSAAIEFKKSSACIFTLWQQHLVCSVLAVSMLRPGG
jgi:hypothetical protein